MTAPERAAALAYRVLLRRQITALPVRPLPILRVCRHTAVLTYDEAAETLSLPQNVFERRFDLADAFTLRRQVGEQLCYLVLYRPDGHPARLNFTLAHELGHRLLGHTGADAAEERAADVFASHLLCPRPALRRLARRFQPLYAEQVAAVCYVSLSAAQALALDRPVAVDPALEQAVDELLADNVDAAEPVTAQKALHPLHLPEHF